jgi:hypothetical protein
MTRYTPLWEQQGSYAAGADRRLFAALWPSGAVTGCAVTPAAGMTVNIAAGYCSVPSQNATGSTVCYSDAVEQVTLTAAPASGTNRIDLITCHPRANDLDGGANNDFIFDYVTGTVAASPVAPAVPAGQLALAQIYVPGASASIAAANVTDVRPGALALAGQTAMPAYTGAGIATDVGQDGEIWVAKAGVNGGGWRKARDVLHARWARNAVFNTSTSYLQVAMDTNSRDPYGLYVTATPGYLVPVAGLYLMTSVIVLGGVAAGDNVGLQFTRNTANVDEQFLSVGGTSGADAGHSGVLQASAGDVLSLAIKASKAGVTIVAGQPPRAYLEIDYLGTG